MARIYTEEGLKKLQSELEERKGKIRHAIAEASKEAKEQGDLSENAEYSEAKHQQNENESRVVELEALLKDAVLAEPKHHKGSGVSMGSKLSVKLGSRELAFEIVGSNEADPAHGCRSQCLAQCLRLTGRGVSRRHRFYSQAPAGAWLAGI